MHFFSTVSSSSTVSFFRKKNRNRRFFARLFSPFSLRLKRSGRSREGAKRTRGGDDMGVAVVAVSVGTLSTTCHSRAYVVDCYERVSPQLNLPFRLRTWSSSVLVVAFRSSSCEIHREKKYGDKAAIEPVRRECHRPLSLQSDDSECIVRIRGRHVDFARLRKTRS